jgi:hypothetical protein
MAQTGFTPIQLYFSSTTTNAPLAANLASGELAINITDGKLFYKDNANAVQVIGWKVVPATAGGTGQTSYAVGDLLYADTTTSLAKLPDVATGNALISGGVSTAPSWGKIGLTTHVSGTLPTANGGTNLTSFTANGVMYASSTSALATSSGFTYDGTNVTINSAPSRDNLNVSFKQLFYNTAGDGATNTVIGQIRSQVRNYGTNIATASFASIQFATDPSAWFKGEIRFLTNGTDGTDGVGTLAAKIDSAQNYVPSVAGKGINFTANTPAAGMTSQLLNWYEEGTWTPNQGAGLTVVGAFSSTGLYTRIGRQVTVTGRVTGSTSINTSGSGIVCTNLPFTVGTNSNSVGVMTNTATNNTNVYVNPGTATMYSSMASGVSGSLFFTVTYSV